jgi:5-methylcytosine-specific restriction endonuclease McrA
MTRWKPIKATKDAARRKYVGTNKLQKWEYQCNKCKKWYKDKEIAVDHIKPVGSLRSSDDLPFFIENLFCEVDNLQVLCSGCHDKKTFSEKT